MPRVRVYYARDPHDLVHPPEQAPDDHQLAKRYALVLAYDFPDVQVQDPDDIFCLLNVEPERWVLPLPPGVLHTSMSVGDVVEMRGVRYLCLMGGWASRPIEKE